MIIDDIKKLFTDKKYDVEDLVEASFEVYWTSEDHDEGYYDITVVEDCETPYVLISSDTIARFNPRKKDKVLRLINDLNNERYFCKFIIEEDSLIRCNFLTFLPKVKESYIDTFTYAFLLLLSGIKESFEEIGKVCLE